MNCADLNDQLAGALQMQLKRSSNTNPLWLEAGGFFYAGPGLVARRAVEEVRHARLEGRNLILESNLHIVADLAPLAGDAKQDR